MIQIFKARFYVNFAFYTLGIAAVVFYEYSPLAFVAGLVDSFFLMYLQGQDKQRTEGKKIVYIGTANKFQLTKNHVIAMVVGGLIIQFLIIRYFSELTFPFIWFVVNRIAVFRDPRFSWKYLLEDGQLYISKFGYPKIENTALSNVAIMDGEVTVNVHNEKFSFKGDENDLENLKEAMV